VIKLIQSLRSLIDPNDRHLWPLLLACSLISGTSRSLFLALINSVIAAGRTNLDWLHVSGLVLLVAVILSLDYFANVNAKKAADRLAIRLRSMLLDRIGGANLRFVEREETARLHYHLMQSVDTVAVSYFVMLGLASSSITLVFNFFYIGWISWGGLLSAVMVSLVGIKVHLYFERLNTKHRQRLDALNNITNEYHLAYLYGYKELRLSNRKESDYRSRIKSIDDERLSESVAETRYSAMGNMATDLFQYLTIASTALLLPIFANVDSVTVLQLLAAILFTVGPLAGVVSSFARIGQTQVSLNNVLRLFDAASATQEPRGLTPSAPLPPFKSLSLRGVTFNFDSRKDQSEDGFSIGPIDLTLQPGEIVFVTGGNGSGKTVLMRLLAGLYHPDGGEILFNDHVIEDEGRQAYRENFACVFNDFFLFKQLLGFKNTPAQAIHELLQHYDLENKTEFRASDGCFTKVELSTGQRKRLALLVALIEQRPILILDEFGAEQDPLHREKFYRTWLPELRTMGKTVIVVSHDDRYFDAADRIIEMDFGKIQN
jgi:putative pyoverdin transport system ATP-binding/permease protein